MITIEDNDMTQKESLLIVAAPGRLRDSLEALLKTLSWLHIVKPVDNKFSALEMMTQHQPKLVLLDNETWNLLKSIKTLYPQVHCLALVNGLQQQQAAKSAGADLTLLKGFVASELFTAIEKLLSSSRCKQLPMESLDESETES
jgi:DNA-binding NarL/FixJ family response regulator